MLGNQVVVNLAEIGCMTHAQHVFNQLLNPSSVSWINLITGYVRQGKSLHALNLFVETQEHDSSHHLDGFCVLALLKACIEQKDLDVGSRLHQHMIEHGLLQTDAFIQSTLVDMYAKCGLMGKARDMFDTLSVRDVVCWTALISGYVEHAQGEEALACFEEMLEEGVSPDAFIFSGSLKACSIVGAVDKGQQLHSDLIMKGLEENVVVSSTLVDMYAKKNFVGEAIKVLETLTNRNIITWNALLSGLAEHGSENTFECLEQLQNERISPDFVTLTCVLQACGKMGLSTSAEEVHSLVISKGGDKDLPVGNTLVDMYAKCGLLVEAQAVFDSLPNPSVVSWNALLGGYVEQQQGEEALARFKRMQSSVVSPDHVTFLHVLKACGDVMQDASEVQTIYIEVLKKGLEQSLFVANTLINAYAKSGMLAEARNLFDGLAAKDPVSWAILILGYAEHAHTEEALTLLEKLQNDNVPFGTIGCSCYLKVFASLGDVKKGRQLHADILRKGLDKDPFLAHSLLDMYVKCGLFAEAREVIDKLQVRTTSLWNTLIKGCMDLELCEESVLCFELMQYEAIASDAITYTCCLHACSSLGFVVKGQELHSAIIKKGLDENVVVACTLVEAYAKWGLLPEACWVFNKIAVKTIFSWTALITGYVDCGYAKEVFECWEHMQCEDVSPDVVIYTCGLRASAKLGDIDKGMNLHMEIVKMGLEQDCNVGCTLVLMYSKCNSLAEGQEVFDELGFQTEVTWTVLMAGYLDHQKSHAVLDCLEQMQNLGFKIGNTALGSGLKACGSTENVYKGQYLCNTIFERGMETDSILGIAMVDMYAKCGLLFEAQRTFDKLSGLGRSTWTVLMTGYADAGKSCLVFSSFDKMSRDGHCPDMVTFLSVLKACAHAGLIDLGEKCMEGMLKYYEILPNLEHCCCMADLFARAGSLEKAFLMISTMPFHPTVIVWLTLLGACRNWRNKKLGTFLFEQVLELDGRESAAYVCISNIYAESLLHEFAQYN